MGKDHREAFEIYERYKSEYGENAFEHVAKILDEYKEVHRENLKQESPEKDFEQSWKPTKGYALEKLVLHILKEAVEALNLKIIAGKNLDRKRLNAELRQVKEHLLVKYGALGDCLPDADLVVYNPENAQTLAIISSKASLAERVAQTAYWKIKLSEADSTQDIKMFLVTLNQRHKAFSKKIDESKSRLIAEAELDCSYVFSDNVIESDKVKKFSELIHDLRKLVNGNKR